MNDRFKFRVWDIDKARYNTDNNFVLDPDGILGEWDSIGTYEEDKYIIEQCTGLKDKNGNLIYEGDIVRCSDGNIYNICWSDSAMIMIAVNTTTKIGDAIYKLKCYDYVEIIGNIHEQAEQKD